MPHSHVAETSLHGQMTAPFRGTECDDKILRTAAHDGCRGVICIANIRRASVLKHLRIHARLALLRLPIRVPAAKHIKIECQTRALASNHAAFFIRDLELLRARTVDALRAALDQTLGIEWLG